MNITFIGAGYVGLVSGIMMSYLGHKVTCLDTDSAKIAQLNQGILPIYEPTLDTFLHQCIQGNNLTFTDNYGEFLCTSSAIFITVGTPPLPSGEADLTYIIEAVDNVAKWTAKDCVIIIKSTVPPGTGNYIAKYLAAKNFDFQIASNPEFLREGSAVEDFLNPDRIVIGAADKHTEKRLEAVYHPLTSKNIPLVSTDLITAELIKYTSNAFLATKVAFINVMANLSEKIGGDIEKLSLGTGLDSRIGKKFLKTGPGFGGSCFPKDIMALSKLATQQKTDCLVLDAVIAANKNRPEAMVDKIKHAVLGSLINKTIAVLGLTFKAETDDLRGSPAIEIIKLLKAQKVNVVAYDPIGMNNAKKSLQDLQCASSSIEACKGADAIVIATEWEEFKELDFTNIYKEMKTPIIIDLRNILDFNLLKQLGFKYYSVGRKDES